MNLKISTKEWVLVGMVAVIALIANLPASITDQFGIKIEYLLITLGAVVFVALLLYMRFTFFLIIVLLVRPAGLFGRVTPEKV